jgi:DNA-binding transcriptional LysR family regulator
LASASARIRGMEEMLDVPLLQRGRRGVRLTTAGRSLLDHARIVLQQVDAMRGELSAYSRGLKGSVRVLANTAALSEHLPRLLADFLAANPTIDLDLEDRENPAIAAAVAAACRSPPSASPNHGPTVSSCSASAIRDGCRVLRRSCSMR